MMKKLFAVLALGGLMISCGGKEKKEEKKEGFEMNRTKTEAKAPAAEAESVPVDLSNKGVGPIKSVTFADEVDSEMAAKGEKIFSTV